MRFFSQSMPSNAVGSVMCVLFLVQFVAPSSQTRDLLESKEPTGGSWVQAQCNEYTFKHADGTCWFWEATASSSGYWVRAPCTEANEIYKKSDGFCWNWYDPAYNNAAESLGWIRVDCDMPNAWKNARTGRCWKYTTQWSQVPCSTPGAVEREGVCRINNEKTAEGQPVPLSEYEQRWASFFQVELGRAEAFPPGTPWPYASLDLPIDPSRP